MGPQSPKQPPSGSRAVIVGNGPSVDAMSPAFWRRMGDEADTLLVGTNRVLCFAALQGVRWDALVMRDVYRDLWRRGEIGNRYHDELWKHSPAWRVGAAQDRATWCHEFVRFADGWQLEPDPDHNREAAVMRQTTVVLMAANWAWHHGVRHFVLVGVDYHGGHAAMIPPYGKAKIAWRAQYPADASDGVAEQFQAAKAAIVGAGGSIVNLSPGTRLGAIPMMAWEET